MKRLHVISYGQGLRYVSYEINNTCVRMLAAGSDLNERIVAEHMCVEIFGDADFKKVNFADTVYVQTLRFSECSADSIEKWLTYLTPTEDLRFHNCQLPKALSASYMLEICISASMGGSSVKWDKYSCLTLMFPMLEDFGGWLQDNYFRLELSSNVVDEHGIRKRANLRLRDARVIEKRSAAYIFSICSMIMTSTAFARVLLVKAEYVNICNTLVKGSFGVAKAAMQSSTKSLTLTEVEGNHDFVAYATRSLPLLEEVNFNDMSLTIVDMQSILDHENIKEVILSGVSIESGEYAVTRRKKIRVSETQLPLQILNSKLIKIADM